MDQELRGDGRTHKLFDWKRTLFMGAGPASQLFPIKR
ncbi:hypothetical protein K3495_g1090 [Podosphaera aphanis]|nr:hypothetical protein K3495_g1090 [Podosphaera aphanis]